MEQEKNLKRLMLVGIAYNQNNAGVYGLILQETDGPRRLPIAIGTQEAHSIEAKLTETIPERPLTHDLMVSIFQATGIELNQIVLKQLENGIYAADLYLTQGEKEMVIDSRSSDAIALAIRFDAPIYATEDLLETASFRSNPRQSAGNKPAEGVRGAEKASDKDMSGESKGAEPERDVYAQYRTKSLTKLQEMLQKAVEEEKYEEAGLIKKVIEERTTQETAE